MDVADQRLHRMLLHQFDPDAADPSSNKSSMSTPVLRVNWTNGFGEHSPVPDDRKYAFTALRRVPLTLKNAPHGEKRQFPGLFGDIAFVRRLFIATLSSFDPARHSVAVRAEISRGWFQPGPTDLEACDDPEVFQRIPIKAR